jgi:hypothetical protein
LLGRATPGICFGRCAVKCHNPTVVDGSRIVFRTLAGDVLEGTDVPARLASDGVVLFAHAGRDRLASAMTGWAEFREHPDADESGFTVIAPRADGRDSGRAGFSRARIPPHTDRALTPRPPTLVAVVIEHSAEVGGQVLLADARRCAGLSQDPGTASLTLEGRVAGAWPVLESNEGLVRLRYRDDTVGRPRAADEQGRRLLSRIRRLSACPVILRLGTGEGYIVHNHRVLHGRESFQGYRRAARLLADVRPDHRFSWLNHGFAS